MSEHKALTGVEIKDAEKGRVEALFSTFDQVDSDKDVTLKDAFTDGAPVRMSAYGHASWGMSRGASSVPKPPIGKGVIRVGQNDAVFEGQFFLKMQDARDTFESVKAMGDLQEWSYGYDILDFDIGDFEGEKVRFLKKLDVPEVSPVLLGAGVGTRTLSVKSDAPFSDEADLVLGDVERLIVRAKAFGSQSAKSGRVLSAANRERLMNLLSGLGQSTTEIQQLLEETDPNKDRDLLIREFAAFQHQITS